MGEASQWEPAEEEEQEEEIQVLPENAPFKYRDYEKKPWRVSQVSLPASFSEVRRSAQKKKAYVDPPPAATRQLNPVYLIMSIV